LNSKTYHFGYCVYKTCFGLSNGWTIYRPKKLCLILFSSYLDRKWVVWVGVFIDAASCDAFELGWTGQIERTQVWRIYDVQSCVTQNQQTVQCWRRTQKRHRRFLRKKSNVIIEECIKNNVFLFTKKNFIHNTNAVTALSLHTDLFVRLRIVIRIFLCKKDNWMLKPY
jgi:hypothetical protein